jgi:hypothetical protein
MRYTLQGEKTKVLELVILKLMAWARSDGQISWYVVKGFALINEKEKALVYRFLNKNIGGEHVFLFKKAFALFNDSGRYRN